MPQIDVPLVRGRFGETSRPDAWWVQPLVVFLALSTFIVYSTWAAFQGANYRFGPLLSPFYSPELFGSAQAVFGKDLPSWFPWPGFIPFSAALLILPFPGLFRFTCYYYRGAYYKAFWADPSNCAVGEPRKTYRGEKKFPLILQNIHRYAFYIAVIFIFILAKDVWDSLWWPDGFHVGVGTIILAVNVTLLSCYTFGCHSFRHLIGGFSDLISKSPTKKLYDCASCLNGRHMRFAWFSLCTVGFSDLYIRMCAMGVWTDWRLF